MKKQKILFKTEKVEKTIKTTANCTSNITLNDIDKFEKDKLYNNVLIEIKGNILSECYCEYVYVDGKRLSAEDFFKNFELS